MKIKFVILSTLAAIFGTAMANTNSALAALPIHYPNVPPLQCIGTEEVDNMLGTTDQDIMLAAGGDDKILGLPGNDIMVGEIGDDDINGGPGNENLNGDFIEQPPGNDNIDGGPGEDSIRGGPGADTLNGGARDDKIFHDTSQLIHATEPDNFKDTIDCGSGNDAAWINVSQDGDTGVNCEIVHSDVNP